MSQTYTGGPSPVSSSPTSTEPCRALFIGAIGVLAETSHLQREAFNLAFRQSGLDRHWDAERYRALLEDPGGAKRIVAEAERRGAVVDPEAVHARKVANFRAAVLREGLVPRPGVIETLAAARKAGIVLGWVTTTGRPTVDLMLEGFGGAITAESFDFICDRSHVTAPKPAGEVYELALRRAGVDAGSALAIEDTPESVEAARAMGIPTVAFPGWAAQERRFPSDIQIVTALQPDLLRARQSA
jgi:HAD superfamily hydrolase (TIGR01509 family)